MLRDLHPGPGEQSGYNFAGFEPGDVDVLRARQDGGNDFVGVVGYQQEDRFSRWFFQDFQQLIRTLVVHFLGQPDNHYLVLRLVGFKAQLTDDLLTFVGVNHPLLGIVGDAGIPLVDSEIRRRQHLLAKIGHEVVAHHRAFIGRFDHREHQMQVGVS